MYAITNRCYNEKHSRTNYVRSSIPYCTCKGLKHKMIKCKRLASNNLHYLKGLVFGGVEIQGCGTWYLRHEKTCCTMNLCTVSHSWQSKQLIAFKVVLCSLLLIINFTQREKINFSAVYSLMSYTVPCPLTKSVKFFK